MNKTLLLCSAAALFGGVNVCLVSHHASKKATLIPLGGESAWKITKQSPEEARLMDSINGLHYQVNSLKDLQ